MIIYSIYRCVNRTNGKVYIGFDSNWPQRQKRHIKDSKNLKSKAYNDAFHKAIRKYGKENFVWEVIYRSKDGNHTKDFMENYFIIENHSFINFINSNGYNMTLGGDGMLGFKHREESKLKNSESSAKEYKFWNLDGTLLQIKNLKKYSEQSALSKQLLGAINLEKRLSYKGYIKYYEGKTFEECLNIYLDKKKKSIDIMGEKHSKTYTLISPNNVSVTFTNLAKFARDNNLNPQSLKQVAMGRIKSNKGWTLP
jgi:group I intron endonuclease